MESFSHPKLEKLLSSMINDTLKFGEFILDQNPHHYGTVLISGIKEIQGFLEKDEMPFLEKNMLDDLEFRLIAFYAGWNEKIENQAIDFYDAYKKIEEKSKKPIFSRDDHPFKIVMENIETYHKADKTIHDIIQKYELKLVDEIEFYSMFFAILILAESVEYYFLNDLNRLLKKFKINNVDLNEIFSLTKKWRNRDGSFQSDIRVMRNAISHFNFNIEYDEKDVNFIITFYPNPQEKEETRVFKGNEIIDFLGNYRYLMETFEHILFIMIIFALLRQFYCKENFQGQGM